MSSLDLVHDGLLPRSPSLAILNSTTYLLVLPYHYRKLTMGQVRLAAKYMLDLKPLFLICPLENGTLVWEHVAVGRNMECVSLYTLLYFN